MRAHVNLLCDLEVFGSYYSDGQKKSGKIQQIMSTRVQYHKPSGYSRISQLTKCVVRYIQFTFLLIVQLDFFLTMPI